MKKIKLLRYVLEPILFGFLSLYFAFAFRLGFVLVPWLGFILVVASLLAYKRWSRLTGLKTIASMAVSLSIVIGSTWITWNSCIDQKKYVTHRMLWSIDKTPMNDNLQRQVRFTFKKFPDEFILVNSDDLEKYLLKQKSNEIDIKFETTSDFGEMKGFRSIQIGELRSWSSDGGLLGGGFGKSPWD